MTERITHNPDQEAGRNPKKPASFKEGIIASSAVTGFYGSIAYAIGGTQIGVEVGGGLGVMVAGFGLGVTSFEKAQAFAREGRAIRAYLMATKSSIGFAFGSGSAGAATGFGLAEIKGAIAGGISGVIIGGASGLQIGLSEVHAILKQDGQQLNNLISSNEIVSAQ